MRTQHGEALRHYAHTWWLGLGVGVGVGLGVEVGVEVGVRSGVGVGLANHGESVLEHRWQLVAERLAATWLKLGLR